MLKNPFGIITRKCRLSDRDFVYRMMLQLKPYISRWRKWEKSHFDSQFEKNRADTIILMKGKRRIGLFLLKHKARHTDIAEVFLSPAYQRKGIGSFLMSHFEEIAKSMSHKRMTLQVCDGNPAIRFYRKHGYRVKGKKEYKHKLEKRI